MSQGLVTYSAVVTGTYSVRIDDKVYKVKLEMSKTYTIQDIIKLAK